MAGDVFPSHDRLPKVVVVGSANVDLIARVPRTPQPGETLIAMEYGEHPGGKGLNQAVAAAQHARTALVARVGGDAYGHKLLAHARERGVSVGTVSIGDVPTGRAMITLHPDGDNTIVVAPLANMTLDPNEVVEALSTLAAQIVLVQFEIPPAVVEAVAGWCVQMDVRLVVNPSPIRHTAPEVLRRADPLLVNEGEAREILAMLGNPAHAGEPSELAAALAPYCASVVVTAGADGAVAAAGDKVFIAIAPRVDVVDSSGAGDAFAGMLCARLARGADLAAATADAATEAARVVATARVHR